MAPQASTVCVDHLSKSYFVPVREEGLLAAVRSMVRRQTREIKAVEEISFEIAPGEVVGFLGPNGAGKTTTLKMLSGLIYPTCGNVEVLGYVPQRRDKAFLKQIALIMGNRNQLQWDIPALDSFELNRAIYRIPHDEFRRTRDEFIELLELEELVHKPIRNLSLGERMKMEIVAGLLHRPRVLFLDEPTLGLDVTMQRRIRTFVQEYNRRYGATVMLTSHYMADVVALCQRVIVIHDGEIHFDGDLRDLAERFSVYKTIEVSLDDPAVDLTSYGEVIEQQAGRVKLRVPKADTPRITAQLLADVPTLDLTVEDPPIEEVIETVFTQEKQVVV